MKRFMVCFLIFTVAILTLFAGCKNCSNKGNNINSNCVSTDTTEEISEDTDDIQIRFPMSVAYTNYTEHNNNKICNYAYVDIEGAKVKIMPYYSASCNTTNIEDIKYNIKNNNYDESPIYLELSDFKKDSNEFHDIFNNFLEGTKLTVNKSGYYLEFPLYSSMFTQTYAIAKWISQGEYVGMFEHSRCKRHDVYGYCENYALEGNLKINCDHDNNLYFINFTDYASDEIIPVDMVELEKEIGISFTQLDKGEINLCDRLVIEPVDSDEDSVVLHITFKSNNGIKVFIGRASVKDKTFEVINTISYNS